MPRKKKHRTYLCRSCGQEKLNHICPLGPRRILLVDKGTQVDLFITSKKPKLEKPSIKIISEPSVTLEVKSQPLAPSNPNNIVNEIVFDQNPQILTLSSKPFSPMTISPAEIYCENPVDKYTFPTTNSLPVNIFDLSFDPNVFDTEYTLTNVRG